MTADQTTLFLGELPEGVTSILPDKAPNIRRFFSLFKLLDLHRDYLCEDAFIGNPKNSPVSYATYQTLMLINVLRGYIDYVRKRNSWLTKLTSMVVVVSKGFCSLLHALLVPGISSACSQVLRPVFFSWLKKGSLLCFANRYMDSVVLSRQQESLLDSS